MEDKTLIQKFVVLIEQDLGTIIPEITKKFRIKNDENNSDFVIEFNSFINIYKEFCFDFGYNNEDLIHPQLIERFILFEKIFFRLIGNVNDPTLHLWTTEYSFSKNILYFRLLFALFNRVFHDKESIQDKFRELLEEWNTSLKEKMMNIQILIPLPKYVKIEGRIDDISINDKIDVKWNVNFDASKIRGDKISQSIVFSHLIIYNTQTLFEFYRTVQERNKKFIENNKKFDLERNHLNKKIREIISTFYLSGIEFKYTKFFSFLPWWFEPDYKIYKKINQKLNRDVVLSQTKLTKVKELYPKVVKSKLFYDDKFVIISHHYKQLINRKFSPDVILDAFIILELILSGSTRSEITYRISINAGFFLAKDFQEFQSIYKLIKDLYEIRSDLIHGHNWVKKMNKIIKKYSEFNNYSDLLNKLKEFVNSCIIKLINLEQDKSNILKKLDDFYIIESSNVIKKDTKEDDI